jgi:hypothetical protein
LTECLREWYEYLCALALRVRRQLQILADGGRHGLDRHRGAGLNALQQRKNSENTQFNKENKDDLNENQCAKGT